MRHLLLITMTGLLLFGAVLITGCYSPVSSTSTKADLIDEIQVPISEENSKSLIVTTDHPLVLHSGDETYEINVLDLIRGREAYALIRDTNMFNPDPSEGYEFLLLQVNLDFASDSNEENTSSHHFNILIDAVEYQPIHALLPEGYLRYPEMALSDGASAMGWLLFQIPAGEEVTLEYRSPLGPYGFISLSCDESFSSVGGRQSDHILSPKMPFIYLDITESNELSLLYRYSIVRDTLYYQSIDGFQIMKADPGKAYVLAYIQVTHRGNRDGMLYVSKTPDLSAFLLYDNIRSYNPIEIVDRITDHIDHGELYVSVLLDRKENKKGYLVFEVPDTFAIHDAYLGCIPLQGKERVYWSLL